MAVGDNAWTEEPVASGGPHVGASRRRVLQVLQRASVPQGVQDLAERTGLHVNTVRFHLDRLVADGYAARDVEPRTEPGRPRLTFTAVASRDTHDGKRSYRLLASILTSFVSGSIPDPALASRDAGRAWGRYLTEDPGPYRQTGEPESIDGLLDLLEDVGFAPDFEEAGAAREIRLTHCPFLEIAQEHREVVCSVHLGLMQGALAKMRAPVTAARLEPFVEPSLCLATLEAASPT